MLKELFFNIHGRRDGPRRKGQKRNHISLKHSAHLCRENGFKVEKMECVYILDQFLSVEMHQFVSEYTLSFL